MTAEAAPTKASLKAWWHHFKAAHAVAPRPNTARDLRGGPHDGQDTEDHPVFGTPLRESLKCACVQISTANVNGELYVWGYVPVVVAKCGLFLKENATELAGVFRVNGSNRRMRDLQAIFEAPPKYGKSLDWKQAQFTSHDVASVFRRYLTQMPEPVIPYTMYHEFRDGLTKGSSQDDFIALYRRLIHSMPRANQYLLLYVLDLLSVFARKSDKNLMDASNLAVIFRPGILNYPDHELSASEHQRGQKVLEFLIAHQDWFMVDVPPPPRNDSIAVQASPMMGVDVGMANSILLPDEPRSASPSTSPTGDWVSVSGVPEGEVGEDWRLDKRSIGRRRTTTARNDAPSPRARADASGGASPLEPLDEAEPGFGMGAVSVNRSRTWGSSAPAKDEDGKPTTPGQQRRLLRKPRPESKDKSPRPPPAMLPPDQPMDPGGPMYAPATP